MGLYTDTDKIKLVITQKEEVLKKVINNDLEIRNSFYNEKRFMDSIKFSSLIEMNDKTIVGFLNLMDYDVTETLFLDIGIFKEFRNQNMAKKAIIDLLIFHQNSKYLIGKTIIDDPVARRMLSFFGDCIYQDKNDIYYFLENEKTCSDYINDYAYESLKEKAKIKSKLI